MHKEPWQNYYLNGQPVGTPHTYGAPIPSGQLAGIATVFMWRQHNEKLQILLQTRAKNKRVFPDYLDVSAAGHIGFGELPLQAALRETHEELGLKLADDDLRFVGALVLATTYAGRTDHELHFIYAYKVEQELQTNFTDQEVTAVDWYDIDEIAQAVKDGHLKLAKADSPLFDFALSAIKRLSKTL